jgi:hypothetical protein
MTSPFRFFLTAALAVTLVAPAHAQLRPHRAEYSLRLGTAANSPRIGKAVQEVTLDCDGWHMRREITASAALTPSLQVKVRSILTGDEDRAGKGFRYHSAVTQNGTLHETGGTVRHDGEAIRATIEAPDHTDTTTLPPATLMPVAAVGSLVQRLSAGDSAFQLMMFSAEGVGEAFRFDVKPIELTALPRTPPSEQDVAVPAARSWPVSMTVTRADAEPGKPMMNVRLQVYDTGVLDRVVIDAGIVTIVAYLQSLQMAEVPAKTPDCSRP